MVPPSLYYYSCLLSDCRESDFVCFLRTILIIFCHAYACKSARSVNGLYIKLILFYDSFVVQMLNGFLSCQARSVQKLVFDNGWQKGYLKPQHRYWLRIILTIFEIIYTNIDLYSRLMLAKCSLNRENQMDFDPIKSLLENVKALNRSTSRLAG